MKLKGKFISLEHTDGTPCILRVDRIVDVIEQGEGACIKYANGCEYAVKESRLEVIRKMEVEMRREEQWKY